MQFFNKKFQLLFLLKKNSSDILEFIILQQQKSDF